MSEAKAYNQPKDFPELKDGAVFMVRQGGLLGTVSTEEVQAKVGGGVILRGSGTYTTGSGAVVFTDEYEATPTIIVTPTGGNAHILATNNGSTTGFDVVAEDDAGVAASGTFDWIAIG